MHILHFKKKLTKNKTHYLKLHRFRCKHNINFKYSLMNYESEMLSLRLIFTGMAKIKLHIDEFDDIDYQLIAIHTSLEDYRLAFLLNQKLRILLHRYPENINVTKKNTGTADFSRFVFEDEASGLNWNLLQNQSELIPETYNKSADLFADQTINVNEKSNLLPEYKNVDYFLQIQNCYSLPHGIQQSIQEIAAITMCYSIETSTLKSRNNLIF